MGSDVDPRFNSSTRTDNRTITIPNIAESSTGVLNLETTGIEPLIVHITGSSGKIGFSFNNGGPYVYFPADTMLQYDVAHPWVGDIHWKTDSQFGGSIIAHIAGYPNYNLRYRR
jgi:hypothetical protein